MQIQVCLLPDSTRIPEASIAVVIDTLRFTTTATEALRNGANDIFVGSDIEEMRALAAHPDESASKLCGERHCHLIEGFHLGNSPFEYTNETVAGRRLFFTTTNGTRAIESSRTAATILLAALVNRSAVAKRLVSLAPEQVVIVCAGTDGEIAAEDTIAAGAIAEAVLRLAPETALGNDEAHLALAAWRDAGKSEEKLNQLLRSASGGSNLVTAGYERDIQFAAQLDSIDCVPCNSPDAWQVFQAE